MKRKSVVLFATVLLTSYLVAQGPRESRLRIATNQAWTNTGIDLHPDENVSIIATSEEGCDPAGSFRDSQQVGLPIPSAPAGALIAKTAEQEPPLLVGSSKQFKTTASGRLFLGINSQNALPCTGNFPVTVTISPAESAAETAATPANSLNSTQSTPATNTPASQTNQPPDIKKKLQTAAQVWLSGQFGSNASAAPAGGSSNATAGSSGTAATAAADIPPLKISDAAIDASFRKDIDGLPRRVNDQFQNEGDMVNFILVGSQDQLKSALEAATWHLADTDTRESAIKAVLQTYQKKDYLTMPMSQLYLFGRVQDFGYEEAEPYSVVASRHHFRIWKAPFTWNGETVWVGAGTHDIGFEKDQRNGKVTHKIDPAVDGERDNIGRTLQAANKVKSMNYYLPPDPVKEAKNATGGGYHSDGRILVVFLE